MDFSMSTNSQTPRNPVKRLSVFDKGAIDSPKLQKNFERLQAEQQVKLMKNRIDKLIKIESLVNKEIDFADGKFWHFDSLQKTNFLRSQEKKERKDAVLNKIEEKRRSLSISRQESRAKKERVLNEILLKNQSKADVLKELKKNWEADLKKQKKLELNKRTQFVKKIKAIQKRNVEGRCKSTEMTRKNIREKYARSIERQELLASNMRKETVDLALLEEEIVGRLANSIDLRNKKINGLNTLIAVSRLPISRRSFNLT